LDAAGYAFDQKHKDKKVEEAVEFLVQEERERVALTSMVACLFSRNVYKEELLARCLRSVGLPTLADNLPELSRQIQKLRWKTRLATGFDPQGVRIPKRFSEVSTWKGPVEQGFLQDLKKAYANRILELARG
jgi:aldehyde:ferredoxin oxidoreductase